MKNSHKNAFLFLLLSLVVLVSYLPWRMIGWAQADTAQSYEIYFAQLADGGGYATQFLLVNPSDVDVSCTLDLFRSNGLPWALTLNGATDSSFALGIRARGTLILKSGNQGGETQVGWARVRSTNPIGGSLIYSYQAGGRVLGEAGLDPSVPCESFRLSLDTQNDYLAGLAIANPNPMPVSLSLILYDSGGNSLASSNRSLGSMEHFARLPAEIFPSYNFYNFTGSIAVQAPESVVVGTTLRFDAGVNVLASIPVIDLSGNPEPQILNFAQIADGAGYATTFCLVNPNAQAINAQLDFFRQDGTPLALALFGRPAAGSHSVTLPAYGASFLYTLNANAGRTDVGWAQVTANGPIGGSVVYSFTRETRVISQAGINPAMAATDFVLPVDQTGGMLAGLAVANPSASGSVTLYLTLFDHEGRQRGTTATWSLQARRQFALMLDQLFPGVNMTNFIGSMVVKAEGGRVAGTTLRFSGDLSVFASIPVISGIPIAGVPSTITTTTSTSTTSTTSTTLAPAKRAQGSLDSPKNGATVSGVGSGSGWAVLIEGKTGTLPAKIELLVDGTAVAIAHKGIARPDVKSYFSGQGITVPDNTGYRFSWASFVYAAGAHTLVIRLTDGSGQTYELTRIGVNLPPGNNNLHSTSSIVGNLRAIPAGTFLQGGGTTNHFLNTLTRNFLVTETEISRKMWADLRAASPTLPLDPSDTNVSNYLPYPVNSITWYQAVLFANLLSVHQGLTRAYYKDGNFTQPLDSSNYKIDPIYCNFNANGYRLPTDGEWEFATRAGTTGTFSVDEPNYNDTTDTSCVSGVLSVLQQVAWFCANSNSTTQPVGALAPNPWGLKDVHGNVSEWTWDWDIRYPEADAVDYSGPSTGRLHAARGGSYRFGAIYLQSAYRGGYLPDTVNPLIGFRLVRTLN